MKAKEENSQLSQKKPIVFQFSMKKKLLTRDWEDESEVQSQQKTVKLNSKKKSVSFIKEAEAIPSPKHDQQPNTPNKPILSCEKRLKSCKEHIKTPYSKERVKDLDEALEGNGGNGEDQSSSQSSKPKLLSAQKLSLSEMKDQLIDKYLASASSKGKVTPKGNDSLLLSENKPSSLSKIRVGSQEKQLPEQKVAERNDETNKDEGDKKKSIKSSSKSKQKKEEGKAKDEDEDDDDDFNEDEDDD